MAWSSGAVSGCLLGRLQNDDAPGSDIGSELPDCETHRVGPQNDRRHESDGLMHGQSEAVRSSRRKGSVDLASKAPAVVLQHYSAVLDVEAGLGDRLATVQALQACDLTLDDGRSTHQDLPSLMLRCPRRPGAPVEALSSESHGPIDIV